MPDAPILILTNPLLFDSEYLEAHYRSLDIGLLYIARYLQDHGIAITIQNPFDLLAVFPADTLAPGFNSKQEIFLAYDRSRYLQYWRDVLLSGDWKIIFLPAYYNIHYHNILKSLLFIRKYAPPAAVIVIGGKLADTMPHAFLKDEFNPIVHVRGEGELTSLELVTTLRRGGNLNGILGLSWLENGRIISTPTRPPHRQLDDFTLPVTMERARMRNLDRIQDIFFRYAETNAVKVRYAWRMSQVLLTSRGCPFRCTFCSESGGTIQHRFHSRHYIIEAITLMVQAFDNTFFHIADAIFLLHRDLVSILDGIAAFKIHYAIQTRGDTFRRIHESTPDIVPLLIKSGCTRIAMGIESFDQKVLDALGKEQKVEDLYYSLDILKNSGISLFLTFISGCPDQTFRSLEETVQYCRNELYTPDILIAFFPLTIITGTILFEQALRKGIIKTENAINPGAVEYYYIDPGSDFYNRAIFLRAAAWANSMGQNPEEPFIPLADHLQDLLDLDAVIRRIRTALLEKTIMVEIMEKKPEGNTILELKEEKESITISIQPHDGEAPSYARIGDLDVLYFGNNRLSHKQKTMLDAFVSTLHNDAVQESLEKLCKRSLCSDETPGEQT